MMNVELLVLYWNCDLEKEFARLSKKDPGASAKLRSLLKEHSGDEDLIPLRNWKKEEVSYIDDIIDIYEAYKLIQSFYPKYFRKLEFHCLFPIEKDDTMYFGLNFFGEFYDDDGEKTTPTELPKLEYRLCVEDWREDAISIEEYLYEWCKEHSEEAKEWFQRKYEVDDVFFDDDNWKSFLEDFPEAKKYLLNCLLWK